MLATVDTMPAAMRTEPGSLGNREQLLADLEEAMRPGVLRMALVIVGFSGFPEFVDRAGWLEGEALLQALAARLDEAVGDTAACYRARRDEFALLYDPGTAPLAALLERTIAALGGHPVPTPLTPAYGTVVVPDEASHPLAALQLADERLAAVAPGRQPRERRRYLRPGIQDAPPDGGTSSGRLEALQTELAEATAAASRIQRVDRLLDLAETLSKLADAAKIDNVGAGRLQGQASGADKIPLLLKELGLKLAALRSLDGCELAEAASLLASPAAGTMRTKVLSALDEIGTVLAAA